MRLDLKKRTFVVIIGVAILMMIIVILEGHCDWSISYFTDLALATVFGTESYFTYKYFSNNNRTIRKSYHESSAIVNAVILTYIIFVNRGYLLVNCAPFKGGPIGGGVMLVGVFLEAAFVFLVSKAFLEQLFTKRK